MAKPRQYCKVKKNKIINSISNKAAVGRVILNAVLLSWIISFLVFIIFILIEYSTLILIHMNLCNHLQLR